MTFTLTDLLGPVDAGAALRADVLAGLTATPKTLPPTWFYDERGSELFDRITRLPEYYPTRCERSILEERAPEVALLTGADTLVELGSGTSEKTRLLLDALAGAGHLRRIVAFDVSEPTLRAAACREGRRPSTTGVTNSTKAGDSSARIPLVAMSLEPTLSAGERAPAGPRPWRT